MSRFASQAKGGFYPTPPAVVERAARMVAPCERHGVSRLLDPCCGEGGAPVDELRTCFRNNLCLKANGSRVLVKGRTYKEYVLTESTEDADVHREYAEAVSEDGTDRVWVWIRGQRRYRFVGRPR